MSERTRETTGPVADSVTAMYAAYGDPVRFDRHLHPEITIWESDQPGPRLGLAELDALRGRRTPAQGVPQVHLVVDDLLVDRWGQVAAVARYVLWARMADGDSSFRVTDVWDRVDAGWRIVHHHAEEVVQAPAVAPVGEGGRARTTAPHQVQREASPHAGRTTT